MTSENVRDRVKVAIPELNRNNPRDPWWRPMHRQRSEHSQYDETMEPDVSHARARQIIREDHVCTKPRCHNLETHRPIAKMQFQHSNHEQHLEFKWNHGSLDSNNRFRSLWSAMSSWAGIVHHRSLISVVREQILFAGQHEIHWYSYPDN